MSAKIEELDNKIKTYVEKVMAAVQNLEAVVNEQGDTDTRYWDRKVINRIANSLGMIESHHTDYEAIFAAEEETIR